MTNKQIISDLKKIRKEHDEHIAAGGAIMVTTYKDGKRERKPVIKQPKSIRQAVIERATELEMTAYAIAHAAKVGEDFIVSVDHVQHYLAGRKDMTSEKVDAVLRVLGLHVS